jgi:hypothetical protein
VPLNGDSVLDTSVLFAMIVYGIAGLFLSALIGWLTEKLGLMQARTAIMAAPAPARSEEAPRSRTAV